MADQAVLELIKDNPIGEGLDAFRVSFAKVCAERGIPCTRDALDQLNPEGTTAP